MAKEVNCSPRLCSIWIWELFITGAAPRVSAMLAVLTVRAAPRAIPRVSAMLALLTVWAASKTIPNYPMCPISPSSPIFLGSLSFLVCPADISTTDMWRADCKDQQLL